MPVLGRSWTPPGRVPLLRRAPRPGRPALGWWWPGPVAVALDRAGSGCTASAGDGAGAAASARDGWSHVSISISGAGAGAPAVPWAAQVRASELVEMIARGAAASARGVRAGPAGPAWCRSPPGCLGCAGGSGQRGQRSCGGARRCGPAGEAGRGRVRCRGSGVRFGRVSVPRVVRARGRVLGFAARPGRAGPGGNRRDGRRGLRFGVAFAGSRGTLDDPRRGRVGC